MAPASLWVVKMSSGSVPVVALRMRATSLVVRPIGPAKSCSQVSGITPAPEAMPSVPRIVTRLAPVEGA